MFNHTAIARSVLASSYSNFWWSSFRRKRTRDEQLQIEVLARESQAFFSDSPMRAPPSALGSMATQFGNRHRCRLHQGVSSSASVLEGRHFQFSFPHAIHFPRHAVHRHEAFAVFVATWPQRLPATAQLHQQERFASYHTSDINYSPTSPSHKTIPQPCIEIKDTTTTAVSPPSRL
jgi:hypothetical protein